MKIIDPKYFSARELVDKLRKVTMLNDKAAFPYQSADIQLTDIGTDLLAPAQCYVLRSEFEKVRDLRWSFLEQYGIDILRLADRRIRDGQLVPVAASDRTEQLGFVEFKLDGSDETITILPPIVETSKEADKSIANIINDGMHRCFTARISRLIPAVIRISGVPEKWPYYAFPLADGWRDIEIVERLQPNLIKKFHRFPHPLYKNYYRDFNSAFTNVGGPRGDGSKK